MTSRAALLTPPGAAGIAVVRLVGPESPATLSAIFRPDKSSPTNARPDAPTDAQLTLGVIHDGDDIIDQVIIARTQNGTTADINCHAGPRITQRLLMLLAKHNVEIVPWQQLTAANSVVQEIAAQLPRALTPTAALALAAQHPGGLTACVQQIITALRTDAHQLSTAHTRIAELLSTYELAQRLLTPASIVLTGPVNAGKSTLANALADKPQSIAANLPGTTRDWTVGLLDIKGLTIKLIDTAGRHTQPIADTIEHHAQQHTDSIIDQADLIVLVLAADQLDQQPHIEHLLTPTAQKEQLILVNKCDLPQPHAHHAEHPDWLYVSATTGLNLDQFRNAIATRLGFADFDPTAPLVFTPRQHQLLTDAAQTNDPAQTLQALTTLLSPPGD